MKKMNSKAIGQLPAILIIAVILIGVVAYFSADDDVEAELEEARLVAVSAQFEDTLTVTLQDWQGTKLGDATITGYLTEHGIYADIYECERALDDYGGLQSPFGAVAFAPVSTAATASGSEGNLVFSGVIGTTEGMMYDLFITDTDTGVGGSTYGDALHTIVVEGYVDSDGNDKVKAISSAEGATAGKTVTIYKRGDMTVVDAVDAAKTSVTIGVADNETLTSQTFGVTISSTVDYSKVVGGTIYFAEIDNFLNTSDVTVNSIKIDDVTVSFKEVSDLSSTSAVYKNRPSPAAGAGTGATLYAITDYELELTRLKSDNKDKITMVIDYDVDASSTTSDPVKDDTAHIGVYLISWNGDEDSEEETETFLIKLDESAAEGAVYA